MTSPASTCLSELTLMQVADGSLRGPEGLAAVEHADLCPRCGPELAALRALNAELAHLAPVEPPLDFEDRVFASIARHEAHKRELRPFVLAGLPALAAACASVAGFLGAEGLPAHLRELSTAFAASHVWTLAISQVLSAERGPALALSAGLLVVLGAAASRLSAPARVPRVA